MNAFESNIPAFERTEHGLTVALQSGGIGLRNQFYEQLNLAQNGNPELRKLMIELIKKRYQGREIDLIITLYPEALRFLLKEGQDLFPDAPVLALYLSQDFKLPDMERLIIRHLVIPDFKKTFETALKLVPEAKRVYVLGGVHPVDKWLAKLARRDLKEWEHKFEFHYVSGLSMGEIEATAADIPFDSIVLITAFGLDENGKHQTAVEAARRICPASKAPVFGVLDTLLGEGIAGGSLISFEQIGAKAGEMTLRMIGEDPENIPRVLAVPQVDMYDSRQLKHRNLSESQLPEGSVIINREFSFWDLKYYALGVMAFITVQAFLIVGLLRQRRRRRSVEEELKTQLRFETLLSEISTGFVNLPAEQIDDAIQNAHERVCEVLDLDLSAIWQVSHEDPDFIYLTHLYRRFEGPPLPHQMDAKGYFPWCLKQVTAGNVIALSTEAAPPEAARDKEVWRHYGIKSSLVFPLSVGRSLLMGALSLNTTLEERTWPEPVVKQLQLLAQVFANTIARRRADHALRESEARLSLATTAAGAGLWIMYLETKEVWVSERTRELFHFLTDKQLTYTSFFERIHPDDFEGVKSAVKKAVETGEKLKCDYRVILPNGGIRWIVSTGRRYPDSNPTRLMGISVDITARKQMEEKARRQWEELAHVSRIGIMSELTASLAHEINQPLTAIQSNAAAARRFLSAREPDIVEVRQILDDIISDNTRAGNIIRRIRSLLKREQVPFEVTDVNELITDVLSLLRADSLLPGLVIITEFSPDLPPVSADRIQLQQVIINLILNASAAMKDVFSSRREIRIQTSIGENGNIEISVTDFGTGIEEDAVKYLFEPFYTSKPEGLGMGLSISQTIVEAHGGAMAASNNAEKGATFSFTLPSHEGGPS